MRAWRMTIPVILAAVTAALAQPGDPASSAQAFFEALRTGDSTVVDSLVSTEALEVVDLMLSDLKNSLRRDGNGTILRLIAAGYPVDASFSGDWSARDYLKLTVSLPIMTARYSAYEMRIDGESRSGRKALLSVTFVGSSGFEIPSEVELEEEDGCWKVTSFMGLNSFP